MIRVRDFLVAVVRVPLRFAMPWYLSGMSLGFALGSAYG
jgi:hypothetical protein